MSAVTSVLVVGAGPAGMCTAIALRKRGIAVELLELRDEIRPLGSGVTMNGSSLRAIDQLDQGLFVDTLAAGASHTAVNYCDHTGCVQRTVQRPPVMTAKYPSGFGILRPALWALLAAATRRSGARLRLSTTVRAIEQDDRHVNVEFSDSSHGVYDLLVGADGLHSLVRDLVFADAPAPEFTGQAAWRAVVPRHSPSGSEIAMYYSPHSKAGFNFLSERLMYVYANENTRQSEHLPREQWLEALHSMLAGYGGVIGWAREQMNDIGHIDRRALHVLLVPSPWYRGRVLLIGDAAHATTPQLAAGAGMAIEDAVVLGEVLDSDRGLTQALAAFMERRFERCRMVVENSLQIGEWEKRPDDPDADPAGLAVSTYAALSAKF